MKQFSKFLIGLIVTMIFASGLALLSSTSAYADAPPPGCAIMHRGLGPENSIPGFKKAFDRGACGGETDARFTSDKQCVLNHDATLNRTTNGSGRVSSRTWRYVSRLRIQGSRAHVATCQQYMTLCKYSHAQVCMIEAKLGATKEEVLSLAQMAVEIMGDQLGKLTIETDTYGQTRTIKNSPFKQVTVAFIGFNRWPSVTKVKNSGADGIIVNRPVMSRARVASAAQAGLWVTPYSIETHAQYARVRHMGADGVMTDSARLIG